ncbi:MAG: hypothetical protein IIW80_05965 [Treponema sp.]|nr:hypothetical protein [Treponema sp.]
MKNRLLSIISATALFLLAVIFPAVLHGEEIIDNDFNYSLDIPEGYKVIGYTPDGMSYQFKHDRLPVDFILKLYAENTYKNSKTALKSSLQKLSAKYENIDTFTWCNQICAITTFNSSATGKESSGWAICVPLKIEGSQLVLLCYADEEKSKNCEQFIISTLNSLCFDNESKTQPGIITSYAYPGTQKKKIELLIDNNKVETSINEEDSIANQFVIDCEFAVLSLYSNNDKWKEAWTRYYRAIFRDSYSRIQKPAFDIKTALYSQMKKKNPENPNRSLNETLLNWVQNFEYVRTSGSKKSDFTNVIDVLCGKGNDCDSRSMLMCCIMQNLGVKSELFISRIYSHAVYGLDLNIPGAKIEVNGINFLLNETTARNIKPGLIAQDQCDTEKWIPVNLP